MENNYKGLGTIFTIFYPTGFVVGTFYAPDDSASAAQALHNAGFSDVRTLTPQEVQARAEQTIATQNPLQRLGTALSSDEKIDAQEYLDLARKGHSMLLVHAQHDDDKQRIRDILVPFGVYSLKYYGKWTVEDLTA